MKKLNITKERFEKSRYFQKKYGKLEYVSESGKLFKTSKGKVLTFLEASKRMFNQKELVQMFADGESGIDKFIASPYFILVAENDSKDKLLCVQRHGLTIAIDLLERDKSGARAVYGKLSSDMGDAEPFIYQLCRRNKLHVIKSIGGFFDDLMLESRRLLKTNKGKVLKFKESERKCSYCGNTVYVNPQGDSGGEYVCPHCGYDSELQDNWNESKKFGRKFNESDDENVNAVQDAYDKYRACSTEPKICHAIKINDDGIEEKVSIWMDSGISIGGIVKAIQDGRLRKVLKFSESTKKFNESIDGLDEELGMDKPKEKPLKKWYGSTKCDFCHKDCGKILYDGMTEMGPWAVMCKSCFQCYGVGVGPGVGQKYQKVGDDYVKVEDKRKKSRRRFLESTGENVEVSAIVKGRGKTIEEAIENFDREIDNLSSDKWGDWSDNYDPETDEYKDRDYWTAEYNKWQEENGGDVDITVVDDRGNADGFYGYVTISNTDEY